ncbi:zinc-binding oxidoreductase [Ophiostoma piceae UAMH 11346]|uniref:Zinc-binding oxidoreductase n=1 Tax=Ophiostoma piceae (strain UAMH 11346) TaxID=1262450 RepID=S3BZP2_OPHP1|nr:zinc-binding oxidoreductase [Ophiostoma piceae UAMH 11346]
MSIPSTTSALVIESKAKIVLKEVAAPRLRDDYVLVKTSAVALNPTDWKGAEGLVGSPIGTRVGCDYAGVVLAVGPKVKQDFKVGDRIAGGAHGSNQAELEDGAFAGVIAVKPDIAFKIPDSVSDQDAATFGLITTTVGLSFYHTVGLGLNRPSNPLSSPEAILIYGGASATGLIGIQFAKLAGYKVITTASAHNADYLKTLGADAVFDYHDSEAALASIKAELAGQPLKYAWDCVSFAETGEFCAKALAFSAPDVTKLEYVSLLPLDFPALTKIDARINARYVFYYTAFGEAFEKWGPVSADKEALDFAREFWVQTSDLIASGTLKAPRAYVNRGGAGLEGVLVGLQELKANKVSAGKLVYTL